VYEQTPSGKLSIANHAADEVKAPAIAAPDTQLSITRSTKVMIVHDKADTTSGADTRSTSRPPPGRDHHESREMALESCKAIFVASSLIPLLAQTAGRGRG
jgi:hypothetical protein